MAQPDPQVEVALLHPPAAPTGPPMVTPDPQVATSLQDPPTHSAGALKALSGPPAALIGPPKSPNALAGRHNVKMLKRFRLWASLLSKEMGIKKTLVKFHKLLHLAVIIT